MSASSTCAAQQPEPATAVLPVKQQPCGGVFGCTQVFCPADFPRQAKEAVAKCVTLVEQVVLAWLCVVPMWPRDQLRGRHRGV